MPWRTTRWRSWPNAGNGPVASARGRPPASASTSTKDTRAERRIEPDDPLHLAAARPQAVGAAARAHAHMSQSLCTQKALQRDLRAPETLGTGTAAGADPQQQRGLAGLAKLEVEDPRFVLQHRRQGERQERHSMATGIVEHQHIVDAALHLDHRQRRSTRARQRLKRDAVT